VGNQLGQVRQAQAVQGRTGVLRADSGEWNDQMHQEGIIPGGLG
jgi:hypothetical protein